MENNFASRTLGSNQRARHILSISGGKDSSALAIYMKDRETWRQRLGKVSTERAESVEMEYVFCDTKEELRETYDYLDILEAFLGKGIVRLADDRGFQHWLQVYGNYLPSPNMRWCTRMLKLKPFEEYVGDDLVFSYVGIRADENRDGYISKKPNIIPVFPFKEDGITKDDVIRILNESGASDLWQPSAASPSRIQERVNARLRPFGIARYWRWCKNSDLTLCCNQCGLRPMRM